MTCCRGASSAAAGDGILSAGSGRSAAQGLLNHTVVKNIARTGALTAAQILLAWVISLRGVMAIPKASSIEHVRQNAAVLDIVLNDEELALLDNAYPAPARKTPLDMV